MTTGRPARVLVAMDSFKGTIDAAAAGVAVRHGWLSERPDDDVVVLPLADGGEGTAEVIAAATPGAEWFDLPVVGPDRDPVAARWLLLPDGTAVVEAASCCGLPLASGRGAVDATSAGLGQLLAAALADPLVDRLVVCLGGTATTDGGAGALVALGARLAGAPPGWPGGGDLLSVTGVDLDALLPAPPRGVLLLTDVTAPLLGPLGAARQFGPQKGADEDDVDLLERALTHWSRVLGGDGERPGAGAAGGIAYALATVWDAVTSQGADMVGRLVGLPGAIAASDLVVTGEGRLDDQSFQGKVVGNVDRLAREDGCRVAAVCGKDTTTGSPLAHVVETAGLAGSVEAAVADPDRWLVTAGRALAATAITTPEMTGTRQRT